MFPAAYRGGEPDRPPLVLLHGFTDTPRTWERVLPALEREHDVLAPALAGHAGGPPLDGELTPDTLPDAVEAAMDAAGFATAHIVGNSLGGYLALRMAARGRARSVVALAPAGGWADDDPAQEDALRHFETMQRLLRGALPHAETIASTPEGRQRAMSHVVQRTEQLSAAFVVHCMRGAGACTAVGALIALVRAQGWPLDAASVDCPVRIVWGHEDKLLPWPQTAVRYRERLLPHAEWVELEGVGHSPQLDVPFETAQLILGMTA